jgi:tetratricopeptide (TPR) repeat protein
MGFHPHRRPASSSDEPAPPFRRRGPERVVRDQVLRFGLLVVTALALAAPVLAAPDPSPVVPAADGGGPAASAISGAAAPSDLRDLDAWIAWKNRTHAPMLGQEAGVFYRRGLMAWKSGQDAEAVRLMRGAATLDPTFAAPHAALVSWYAIREPSEALQQAAAFLQLLRRNFVLQLELSANVLFVTLTVLFFGLLAAGLVLLLIRQEELRHMWFERLGRVLSPVGARTWAWVFLALPFLAGFGLALPALLLLGMLWPVLRARERVVVVLLAAVTAAAPYGALLFGRAALAHRADSAPFWGVTALENEPWDAALQTRLADLSRRHSDNGYLAFGLAWTARRGGDLATAERAYRQVLKVWPDNDRALNNLGNLLAVRGELDGALELYQRAAAARPNNPAPHFNASQVYTRRFDYRAASQEVSRAAALDFDFVRSIQAESSSDLPLADQWLEPRTFWMTLVSDAGTRETRPLAPPGWRGMVETSGWPASVAALVLLLAGVLTGVLWQSTLPLRTCSNCGHVLCRRCAERRRETALCSGCAVAEARAESPEFSHVLLARRRRAVQRVDRAARTALATLIPGYGALAFGRVVSALTLLFSAAWLVAGVLGVHGPFTGSAGLFTSGPGQPLAVRVVPWITVFGLSVLGFIFRQARLDAQAVTPPARSRSAQVPHRPAEAA